MHLRIDDSSEGYLIGVGVNSGAPLYQASHQLTQGLVNTFSCFITLQLQHTKAALTPTPALRQTLQKLCDGFAAVGVSLNPHNRTHCVMSRCVVQVFKCITGRCDWLRQNLLQRKRRGAQRRSFCHGDRFGVNEASEAQCITF